MSIQPINIPWQSLYPFQRSGMPSLQSADWNGQEHSFVVQWHEDRAYFQLEGEPIIWATLDSCTESDALDCWREALNHRCWGVCFQRGIKIPNGSFYLSDRWLLQFIYAPNGVGFLREWSSPDWIYFSPQETRAWCLFPDLVLPREHDWKESRNCCQHAIQNVRDSLLYRTVSNEEIERLSWKSATNESEFLRVMGWLWNAGILRTGAYLHNYNAHLSSTFICFPEHWNGSTILLRWLGGYFVGEGFKWRQSNWGKRRFRKLMVREPHIRAFFEPCVVRWSFVSAQHPEPTFHEQLEARFQLRDWLQEKAPEADIEAWLTPQT